MMDVAIMRVLENPELAWERPAPTRALDRAEIERRIGPIDVEPEALPGGLANANVRVGRGRVLRVYRRDPGALAKEARLLEREWRSFVVPKVLARGADFLLLEEVPHGPLEDAPEHGAAIGRALAEIHATRFERSGFLDGHLRVVGPGFGDAFATLRDYSLGCLASRPALRDELERFLRDNEYIYRESCSCSVLLHADFKTANVHWARGAPLVLDWEFAWAGPALLDVGQLFRWGASPELARAFAASYRASGGTLPDRWLERAAEVDLFNMAGLIERAEPGSRREADVTARMRRTIQGTGAPPG
jgi:hypothetical protein